MAEIIRMPKMSDTMEEGVLVKWLKKEGDSIQSGDILAEVETDKAVMELENYEEGDLLHIAIKEGEQVAVNGMIAIVGKKGESITDLLSEDQSIGAQPEPKAQAARPVETPTEALPTPSPEPRIEDTKATPIVEATEDHATKRLKASPLAKKMASELGYDLYQINGSGEDGRIIKRDILSYEPHQQRAKEAYRDEDVSQMRKTIAARLSESKFSAPHFYLSVEAEVSALIRARKQLNEQSATKISFNDLVVKASALALRRHPSINSSWQSESIRYFEHIHIGVAVSVTDGLLVPVVRYADQKGLEELSSEIKTLVEQARGRDLKPEQWSGSTFSISNLGMFGIDRFTAIINTPNACILAVGGIQEQAIVRDGALHPGKCMNLTLSCDHRVVDGAMGAQFLKTLKGFLEDPVQMLL